MIASCQFTGFEVGSIPSSASGKGIPSHTSEVNSGRLVYIPLNNTIKPIILVLCFCEIFVIEILTFNRSSKKRTYSASGNSSGGLEPVAEEYTWHHANPNFKLARLSENGMTPDQGTYITCQTIVIFAEKS